MNEIVRSGLMKRVIVESGVLAMLALTLFSNVYAEEVTPKSLIKATLDNLVDAVEKYPGESQATVRREALRKIIDPHFDFAEMSKRSLGTEWKSVSAVQKKRFVDVFSSLLARTYLSKIELVKRGTVQITGAKDFPATSGGVQRASVKSMVTHNGDQFPIEYRMYNMGKGWKVYDVIVENIGLVSNYRSEFAGVIRGKGVDGLIADLEKKEK